MNTHHIPCPHQGGTHTIHLLQWPARIATGALPVFCVHGLTRRAEDFIRLAETLSATRTVYAISMAGRGHSSWLPDYTLYGYPQYIADCLFVLNTLGLTKVDWVGTSMGGLIGMMIGAAPQHPINRLVLNDIGPFLPLSSIQRLATYAGIDTRFADMRQAEMYCRQIYSGFGIKSDKDWQDFTASTVVADDKGGYRLHYDLSLAKNFVTVTADIDLWAFYDALTTPVLLLRGVTSDLLLADTAHAMTQRGPQARLMTFPDCGHAPALLEREQIAAIESFLNEP